MEYISLDKIAVFKQGKQVPIDKQSLVKKDNMVRFVRIVDYTNTSEPPRYIEDFGERYWVDKSDIVMIRYGSQTAGTIVRGIPGIIANNMFQVDVQDQRFNVDFMFYYLSSSEIKHMLMNGQSSSTMPAITFGMMKQIMVPIFSLEDQNRVASILQQIENKINLNTKINNNLEQQAQAIYSNMVPYSVDDALPTEWYKGTVEDIIEIHDSKRIPLSGQARQKMEKKTYPYYGAASLMDYVDNYIFDGKYLLLGEDGTVVDAAGFPILQYVWGKFWVNNHAHILTGKRGFNVESLMLLFRKTPVKSIVTGAVQPKISQANLKSIPIVIPSKSVLYELNSVIEPLFAQIRLNIDENKSLAALRDALLPKLMSGEIDASDITI